MRPVKLIISAFGPYADTMPEIDFTQFEEKGLFWDYLLVEPLRATIDDFERRLNSTGGAYDVLELEEAMQTAMDAYAGGVMSDSIIREKLTAHHDCVFALPEFSSDNAAGTAVLSFIKDQD